MLHLTAADRKFWGRWMLATTIAIAIGNALNSIGYFIGPILLAIAQGWALRGYWQPYRQWGLATLIGGYLAVFAFIALVLFARWPVAVSIFICGALIGGPQAWVLWRHQQPWRWWPLISAIVLTLSLFWFMPGIIDLAIYGDRSQIHLGWLTLSILTGLIGGTLKGLALIQCLHHQHPS